MRGLNIKPLTGSAFSFDEAGSQVVVNRRLREAIKQLFAQNIVLEAEINRLKRAGFATLRAPTRTTTERDKINAVDGSIIHHPNNIEAKLNGEWVVLNGGIGGGNTDIDIALSPYQLTSKDYTVWCDTTLGPITLLLPPVFLHTYRIINIGTAGNNVTVIPNGTDSLNTVNASDVMIDLEKWILTGNPTHGWA